MFTKKITIETQNTIAALNYPQNWSEFQGNQELSIDNVIKKTASKVAKIDKSDPHLDGFDLEAAIDQNPEHLFVKVFAIKKDEPNDNGDAFSEEELVKSAHTFIGKPVFVNHENTNIEEARGSIVHAWYDYKMGGIYTINMVDKVAYPPLARGIETGVITGTSMGCQVKNSICSICHNVAYEASEYCTHVKNQKTRKFSGKVKCSYHNSKSNPDDKCPVCSSTKGSSNTLEHKEAKVYEHNRDITFIEDSFVVNPACQTCLVDCVLNVSEMATKLAGLQAKAEKLASYVPSSMVKVAGKTELDMLNKAMKYMEVVAKSMMDQKEAVSMDYVSDIVDLMANAEGTIQELVEMGYGQIQSPPTLLNPDQVQGANTGSQIGQQVDQAQIPAPQAATPPAAQAPAPAPNINFNSLNPDIASITKPNFSTASTEKIKDLKKLAENINGRITGLLDKISHIVKDDIHYHLTKNDITVAFSNSEGNIFVSAFRNENLIKSEKLNNELADVYHKNKDEAALRYMNLLNEPKESQTMSTNNKTASNSYGDKLTEQQLEDNKSNPSGRQEREITTTTEGKDQLGGKELVNDTNSDSPQVRKDKFPDTTTEGQLEKAMKDSEIQRWNSYPDNTTEVQLKDFDKVIGEVEEVTSVQLDNLRKNNRWVEPTTTTQGQLESKDNWLNTDNAWTNKEASAAYAKALVKAATNALAETIASYKKTPQEVVSAVKTITKNPQNHIKAAFITLVNGMPTKVAQRKQNNERASYFDKFASAYGSYNAVDALLASLGDNCVNLKAEDLIDATKKIASSAEKMKIIESLAKEKLVSASSKEEDHVDVDSALEDAFNEQFKKNDSDSEKVASDEDDDSTVVASSDNASDEGDLYEVTLTAEDVGGIDDKNQFLFATEDAARQVIAEQNSDVDVSSLVLASATVDDENDSVIVVATLKQASKLTAPEVVLYEKFASAKRISTREGLVRQAQAMGGDMGGMPGGAPPAAGMPTPPPAAGAPPMETMDMEGEDTGDAADGESDGKEPRPFLTSCMVCGGDDVDVVAGKWTCNNPKCGAKGDGYFIMTVKEGPNIGNGKNDENGEEEGKGFDIDDDGASSIPVAASTNFTQNSLAKFASQNPGLKIAAVSPLTGTTNTKYVGAGTEKYHKGGDLYLCLDTGSLYSVHNQIEKATKVATVEKRWEPKAAASKCTSCEKSQKVWDKALTASGITSEEFDNLSWKGKIDKIIEMKTAGHFATVKTASKETSILRELQKKIKVASSIFPYDACVAKVANRYGENAVAISGPNKGEKLAECVCNQLKKAQIYSDGVATKVAEVWSNRDGCVECMEYLNRKVNIDLEKAAEVCEQMQFKYAGFAELLSNEFEDNFHPNSGGNDDNNGGGSSNFSDIEGDPSVSETTLDIGSSPLESGSSDLGNAPKEIIPLIPAGSVEDLPPSPGTGLSNNGGEQTITIDIPASVADALQNAITQQQGGQGNVIDIDLPEDSVDNNSTGDIDISVEEDGSQDSGNDNPFEKSDDDSDKEISTDDDSDDDKSTDDDSQDDDKSEDKGGFDQINEGKDSDSDEEKDNTDNGDDAVENEQGEFKEGNEEKSASYLQKGLSRVGHIHGLDLSKLVEHFNKQAETESKVKVENPQDVVDGYTASNGSVIGNEEKFDAAEPNIPQGDATIGNEEKFDADELKVPSGDATLGNEKELGYTSDDLNMSGKVQTASTQNKKTASDKKLKAPTPTEDEVEGKVSKNEAKLTGPKVPEGGDKALMGNEKDTIGSVPKPEKDGPKIPSASNGGKLKGDENDISSEKTENIKGTTIASSENEAIRIAGKMLTAGIIDNNELGQKIVELQSYKVAQLKDIEKSLFRTAKGLQSESGGSEGFAPVIAQGSNERSNLSDDLKSLFASESLLGQQVSAAEETDEKLRRLK